MTFVHFPLTRLARLRAAGPALASLGLAALLVSACASPTPYGPRMRGEMTGYTDMELTPTRYRVTFTGNSLTSLDQVETYLLLRSAEVTQAAGYQYFVFDTRNTRANTTYNTFSTMPPDPWFRPWRPYPYWGRYSYWGGWGFAYQPSVDVVARTNYQAYAEIVLLTPEQAAKEPRSIKAIDVIRRLGPEAAASDKERGGQDRPVRPAPPPPPPA